MRIACILNLSTINQSEVFVKHSKRCSLIVARYHLRDVIVGKIYFLLVRIKIKHMEIAIIKRETTGIRMYVTCMLIISHSSLCSTKHV